MRNKELLTKLANCSPDATVNVAITDGIDVRMYPATSIQVLTHNVDGKEIKSLMVITNINENKEH